MNADRTIRLFLCGDVMTGRGIDQILAHPGNPQLYERCVRDARDYVRLAERANGPIRIPVEPEYIWGEALEEIGRADVRIINLETSITLSDDYCRGKEVLYRMSPSNVACLTAARIDCCCLANNHVLDWGYRGLEETLRTLDEARVARTGAGRNVSDASAPAILDVPDQGASPGGASPGHRVLVFAVGSTTSGIPRAWKATEHRPGVNLLDDLSPDAARGMIDDVCRHKRPGDVAVVSIHWGPNWGYEVPDEQIEFAHQLIDGGVDVVHGHSSHHVKPIEIYRQRLILYGCGDLITDYEGISGHEAYRGDLGLLYLIDIAAQDGQYAGARLVPMQMRRLRLNRATQTDAEWLRDLLNGFRRHFGIEAHLVGDGTMTIRTAQLHESRRA